MGTQYEEDVITDENNAAATILLSRPSTPFRASFLIKGTGSITPPAHGDGITITDPDNSSQEFFCNAGSMVRLSRKISVLQLDLVTYPDIDHVP